MACFKFLATLLREVFQNILRDMLDVDFVLLRNYLVKNTKSGLLESDLMLNYFHVKT